MAFRCPGSAAIKQPEPEEITCGQCGAEAEIWTDEAEAGCSECGASLSRLEVLSSCLDWCEYARECAGEDAFRKYSAQKSKQTFNAPYRQNAGSRPSRNGGPAGEKDGLRRNSPLPGAPAPRCADLPTP